MIDAGTEDFSNFSSSSINLISCALKMRSVSTVISLIQAAFLCNDSVSSTVSNFKIEDTSKTALILCSLSSIDRWSMEPSYLDSRTYSFPSIKLRKIVNVLVIICLHVSPFLEVKMHVAKSKNG